jgi:hypothetical protein
MLFSMIRSLCPFFTSKGDAPEFLGTTSLFKIATSCPFVDTRLPSEWILSLSTKNCQPLSRMRSIVCLAMERLGRRQLIPS